MSHGSHQRETPATTSSSSPHKSNTTGRLPFAQELPDRFNRRLGFATEMSGLFVGELALPKFFSFLRKNSDAKTPTIDFSKVPQGRGKEEEMYGPFMRAVAKSGVLSSFNLFDTSSKKDAVGKIKPDLGLFAADVDEDTAKSQSLSHMDVFVEIKPQACQDAFTSTMNQAAAVNDEIKQQSLLKMTDTSIKHRGQQIDYASQIMALQHRSHLFSISIIGHHARFIRWDRAGACVSECFDYRDTKSNWLGEFLFRYVHATPEERGFDPHVQRAKDEELEELATAVDDHLAKFDYPVHQRLDLQRTCDSSYPAYKISVKDKESKEEDEYIICRPFFEVPSLCSRATRGYLAVSMTKKVLVFLKDTWRVDEDGMLSEAEVYAILREYKEILPFLPVILASGDVVMSDGQPQCTKTQEFVKGSQWEHHTQWLRKHVRHRVVQELALPLRMVRNDKELLEAIRNVLIVIKVAYHKGGILHRDISAGNIMLNLCFGGILNDWDHAINAKVVRESHPYRTGTWQFMSIGLLRYPGKPHSIHDDVESAFWVLYHTALHYFKLKPGSRRPSLALFDEQDQEEGERGQLVSVGGFKKGAFLQDAVSRNKIKFESQPINNALCQFAEILDQYRAFQESVSWSEPRPFQHSPQKIEQVDDLIKIFTDITAPMQRPDDLTAAVEDQFPKESIMDAHRRATAAELHSLEMKASTSASARQTTGDRPSSDMPPPSTIPIRTTRSSASRAGSSRGPDTLSGSTMPVPPASRTTSRSSSKRRISDSEEEVKEESPVEYGRRAKKEKKEKKEKKGEKGKQVARTSSGRYVTRSHDKKKTA